MNETELHNAFAWRLYELAGPLHHLGVRLDVESRNLIARELARVAIPGPTFDCHHCGARLAEPGAIYLTPPVEFDVVKKVHICVPCSEKLEAWIGYEPPRIVSYEDAAEGLRRAFADPTVEDV